MAAGGGGGRPVSREVSREVAAGGRGPAAPMRRALPAVRSRRRAVTVTPGSARPGLARLSPPRGRPQLPGRPLAAARVVRGERGSGFGRPVVRALPFPVGDGRVEGLLRQAARPGPHGGEGGEAARAGPTRRGHG